MNQSDKKDNQIDNSILNHGVLNKDLYNAYVINKVQKLSKAFYLITNFFDLREPLKWSIRDLSLKLVQHGMSLSLASLSHREKSLMEFVSITQELDILMDTAQVAGFISSMNAEVIKRELKGLVVFVEDKHDMHYSTSSRLMLTPSYFKVDEVKSFIAAPSPVNNLDQKSKYQMSQKPTGLLDRVSKITKDIRRIAPQNESLERRKKVLDIGRTLELFSIKDISTQITDCSEKTIQRLLIDMVNDGSLIKEGERRWSRYMIAK